MAVHELVPRTGSLHGQFSTKLPPALAVEDGDTVRFTTLDVSWGVEQHDPQKAERARFEPRDSERDNGPALIGPVAIRDAEPGMVLEVQILELRPGSWGWTYVGDNGFNRAINAAMGISPDEKLLVRWELDADNLIGISEMGCRVKLAPFMGIIGVAPCQPGLHSAWRPRVTGGNLDCRDLQAGSSLFLPIEVPGALVSVGDGHALQGNGEVGGSAIECPMERADLRFVIHPDPRLPIPCARTPESWITFGFGESLDDATTMALHNMIELIMEQYGVDRTRAIALASLHVDLRITQIVNDMRGAHAALPRRFNLECF
jgi:acetamidase/formamidase